MSTVWIAKPGNSYANAHQPRSRIGKPSMMNYAPRIHVSGAAAEVDRATAVIRELRLRGASVLLDWPAELRRQSALADEPSNGLITDWVSIRIWAISQADVVLVLIGGPLCSVRDHEVGAALMRANLSERPRIVALREHHGRLQAHLLLDDTWVDFEPGPEAVLTRRDRQGDRLPVEHGVNAARIAGIRDALSAAHLTPRAGASAEEMLTTLRVLVDSYECAVSRKGVR